MSDLPECPSEYTEHQLGAIAMTEAGTIRRLIILLTKLARANVFPVGASVLDSMQVIAAAFDGTKVQNTAELARIDHMMLWQIIDELEYSCEQHIMSASGHLGNAAREKFTEDRQGPGVIHSLGEPKRRAKR